MTSMTVSYRGDTRISVSQAEKECYNLDQFLKGKSLGSKIIVLKEEREGKGEEGGGKEKALLDNEVSTQQESAKRDQQRPFQEGYSLPS